MSKVDRDVQRKLRALQRVSVMKLIIQAQTELDRLRSDMAEGQAAED